MRLEIVEADLEPGPVWRDLSFRIAMTTSCKDCQSIPKVKEAGTVIEENGQRIQIMHNGVRVLADGYDGSWMTEIIRQLKGHHEPQEELVFHEIMKILPKKATMIELGGYWSYYSLWFLHSAPQHRRAIVIEPDPQYIEVGRKNAFLNKKDIEFFQACIGNEYLKEVNFDSQSSGCVSIPQFSVEHILKTQNIKCLDVLHCDTQGAEISVITSCADLFRENRIRFCVFSTHHQQFTRDALTHQRCLAILRSYGGQILVEHDVHESYSGDGLIVAYFGSETIDWPLLNITYNRYSNALFRNPIFDIENLEKKIAEKDTLEKSINELREKYKNICNEYENITGLSSKDINNRYIELKYVELYDRLQQSQKNPFILLFPYIKWKLNTILLKFNPVMSKTFVIKTRTRINKTKPLPVLFNNTNIDYNNNSYKMINIFDGKFKKFLSDKKYRKSLSSKAILLLSPVLTKKYKEKIKRRYNKSRTKIIQSTQELDESSQIIFNELEKIYSLNNKLKR